MLQSATRNLTSRAVQRPCNRWASRSQKIWVLLHISRLFLVHDCPVLDVEDACDGRNIYGNRGSIVIHTHLKFNPEKQYLPTAWSAIVLDRWRGGRNVLKMAKCWCFHVFDVFTSFILDFAVFVLDVSDFQEFHLQAMLVHVVSEDKVTGFPGLFLQPDDFAHDLCGLVAVFTRVLFLSYREVLFSFVRTASEYGVGACNREILPCKLVESVLTSETTLHVNIVSLISPWPEMTDIPRVHARIS